ncbi:MAG TPA: hypothetical protein PLC53_02175 [Bacilli bacterium]|nr:hypothetical protein [Bacilli bacterium]
MKKLWNFILKNRLYILIFILLVVGVFAFITLKAYLYPEDENTVYGDRLDGIEDVEITNDRLDEIVSKIKENEGITEASVNIQGKIINMNMIATLEDNSIEAMEELSTTLLENFSEEEIAFYDFQVFVQNKTANYNLIGYKNKKNDSFSWSSDLIVSEVEDEVEEEN